ncbi:MAG: hypothetical protein DYG92_06520 [Leptolyngbya sp. PLA1]|nr:hypothetical protein [Leptolyngbya sp. PLA1]
MNARLLPLLAAPALLGACTVSRHDQVKAHAQRTERALVSERDRTIRSDTLAPARDARLGHLSTLRLSLSAANIALGSVPYAIDEPKRPAAYDVLDEVYSTIEWNIPLGPGDSLKPLPRQFQGNVLRLD